MKTPPGTITCAVKIEQCGDGSIISLSVTSPRTGQTITVGSYGMKSLHDILYRVERAGWRKAKSMWFAPEDLRAILAASRMVSPRQQFLNGVREKLTGGKAICRVLDDGRITGGKG